MRYIEFNLYLHTELYLHNKKFRCNIEGDPVTGIIKFDEETDNIYLCQDKFNGDIYGGNDNPFKYSWVTPPLNRMYTDDISELYIQIGNNNIPLSKYLMD